jgi:hypothetical protein
MAAKLPLLDFGDPRFDVVEPIPGKPDVLAFLQSISPGCMKHTTEIDVRMIKKVLPSFPEGEFYWTRGTWGGLDVRRRRNW